MMYNLNRRFENINISGYLLTIHRFLSCTWPIICSWSIQVWLMIVLASHLIHTLIIFCHVKVRVEALVLGLSLAVSHSFTYLFFIDLLYDMMYEDHFDYFYFRAFIEFMFFSVFSNSLFRTGKLTVISCQRGTTKVFKNPTSPSQNTAIPLNFKNSVTATLFLASSLVC